MDLHTNNKLKKYISWQDFYQDTLALCKKIKENHQDIKGIIAIARGGLIPAAIIAYELDIYKSDILELRSYDDKGFNTKLEIKQLPKYALEDKGNNWIIIDELVDKGGSIQKAKELLPLASSYVVYSKIEKKLPYLSGYVRYIPNNYWICLPWSYKKYS